MFAYFRAPAAWHELIRRTAVDAYRDRCAGLAAELAFYFFLAVFPAILVLLALLSLLPMDVVLSRVISRAAAVAPPDVLAIVRDQVTRVLTHPPGGLLTIAVVGALWSSSAAMTAIIDALNRAYDIQEWRSWWRMRLLAIVLTLALAVFTVTALALVVGGTDLARWMASRLGGGPWLVGVWRLAQWPLAFVLVVVAIGLVYHFAPNADNEWTWLTPGSIVATTLWLAASIGFKLYLQVFGEFGAVYGSIAGVMVLLLWFYLAGFALLIGAELNAEIDKALPSHDRGPQSPTRRKAIGPAAERRAAGGAAPH